MEQETVPPSQVGGFETLIGPYQQTKGELVWQVLFPHWRTLRSRDALFAYMERRMCELAERGELSIAELHNQEPPLPDYAGMIILGQRFDDDDPPKLVSGYAMEFALENLRVKVRSRECTNVKGEPIRHTIEYKQGKIPGTALSQGRVTTKGCKVQLDKIQRSTLHEMELPLQIAWRVMHQHGAHCVRAIREDTQRQLWWFEEVVKPRTAPIPDELPEAQAAGQPPHLRKRA